MNNGNFFKDYINNKRLILYNLQAKLSKFQLITKSDFSPYTISENRLKDFNVKFKGQIFKMARKVCIFYISTIPIVISRIRYVYNNSQRIGKCIGTIGVYSLCSFAFMFYQNKHISKFIQKELKSVVFDHYVNSSSKNTIKSNYLPLYRKLFYHQIKEGINTLTNNEQLI